MPKVSIIIPCYNAEQYLANAIDSVIAQSFKDFELLIIIDGSPDKSKQIAEGWVKRDNRIKVFDKANSGVSSTRNYGLEKAQGDFIYYMDSDDWIEKNLLEDNLKIIEENNLNFIVFGYVQDDENDKGDIFNTVEVAPKLKQLVKGDKNINLDSYDIGLLGYVWNKVYRKSFLIENQCKFPLGISWGEDFLFNVPVFIASDKIFFNSKCYYHYLNRPQNSLAKTFRENLFELIIKKSQALKVFLRNWQVLNREQLLSSSFFSGFKYCILNLSKTSLSKNKKRTYLKYMCSHPKSVELLSNYAPKANKDKLLLFLIRNKQVRLINFLRAL